MVCRVISGNFGHREAVSASVVILHIILGSRPRPRSSFSEIAAPFRRAALISVTLSKNDPTLGEIVGRHFEMHAVADDRANAKFAHLAGGVSDDLVLVVEQDGEASIGKNFLDDAFDRQQFFFGQSLYVRKA